MDFKDALVRAIETMASFVIVTIMALFAIVTVYPLLHEIPRENQQMVGQQISTLQNVVLIIVAFFFGQNSGNMRKDQTIDKLAKNQAQPAPTTEET